MPLFDFTCTQCGHIFEELVRGSEKPACPACGSQETTRGIAAPSPLRTGAFPFKIGPVRPMPQGGGKPPCMH
ncbi:MAG: zinc ribbon domain-containing protein [Desulfovibrio sp.]|nr:zinc ribbon domain-containing protein [Desulfovibrio sp.]